METGENNLEKIRFVILTRLSEEFLDSEFTVDMSSHISFISNEIALRVKSYVWGDAEEDTIRDVRYPQDWWQAFKKRWFPDWLESRYPVLYTTVTITARAIYPTFKPKMPGNEYRVILQEHVKYDKPPVEE